MVTISFCNHKGGVGKTSSALACGAALMRRGYRVLFVDMDYQCNLTFLMRASTAGATVYQVMREQASAQSAIIKTKNGDVIAGSPALSMPNAFSRPRMRVTDDRLHLLNALKQIKGYDFCVIDCPPALSIMTLNALYASTGVVIPATADILSLKAFQSICTETIKAVSESKQTGLKVYGVLLTQFDGRPTVARQMRVLFQRKASEYNTKVFSPVRRSAVMQQANALREADIFSYAPKSNPAKDYETVINELLQEVQ